eukprot:gene5733-6317_t
MDFEKRLLNNEEQLKLLKKAIEDIFSSMDHTNKQIHRLEGEIPKTLDSSVAAHLVDQLKEMRMEKAILTQREDHLRQEAAQTREANLFLYKLYQQKGGDSPAMSDDTSSQEVINLLKKSMSFNEIDEEVVHLMHQRFPDQVSLMIMEGNAGFAADIYKQTRALPCLETENHLQQQGYRLCKRVFMSNEGLLACFKDTQPCLLKVLTEEQFHQLLQFSKELKATQDMHSIISFEMFHLRNQHFIIMPRMVCSARELPLPLTTSCLSALYKSLCESLHGLHSLGCAHLNVQLSSLLISQEGLILLGDLASIRPFGEYLTASPSTPLPKDYPGKHVYNDYTKAHSKTMGSIYVTAETDWWMAAMLLLEVAGQGRSNVGIGEDCAPTQIELIDNLCKCLPSEIAQDLLDRLHLQRKND